MTKRIKITDPKDLREGMRVEIIFKEEIYKTDVEWLVYKDGHNPIDKQLRATYEGYDCYPQVELLDQMGILNKKIESIYRLIDGIEDVVVGDILEDDGGSYVMVLGQTDCVYFLSGQSDSLEDMQDPPEEMYYGYTMSKHDLVNTFCVYTPEEEKTEKTELTETEAKEIIAEQKGVEPEDIVIKKDE